MKTVTAAKEIGPCEWPESRKRKVAEPMAGTINDEYFLLAPAGGSVRAAPPPGTPAGYQFNHKANSAYLLLIGLFP